MSNNISSSYVPNSLSGQSASSDQSSLGISNGQNIVRINEIGSRHQCPKCPRSFTRKSSLDRHLKEVDCTTLKPVKKTVTEQRFIMFEGSVKAELLKLRNELGSVVSGVQSVQQSASSAQSSPPVLYAPVTNMNNLQIMCLSARDNLLDILASRETLPNALTYIKGCALSRLAGDCRILEKAYQLATEQPAIMYANKSKTKFVYYDERRRRTVETNMATMAKKLADILQNSYLKGMESFGINLAGEVRENYMPHSLDEVAMPTIEPYDLNLWNDHIHELRDEKYQKKLLKNLKIPFENNDQSSSSSSSLNDSSRTY